MWSSDVQSIMKTAIICIHVCPTCMLVLGSVCECDGLGGGSFVEVMKEVVHL